MKKSLFVFMRQKIINQIDDAISSVQKFFFCEQSIQLYLANYLIDSKLFDNVFIEYRVPVERISQYPWNQEKIYIDIVVEKDHKFYPIEIKYKTAKQETPYLLFDELVKMNLEDQGAKDLGCYDFWKDIKRIECLEASFQSVERGIVLFITNDLSYKKDARNPKVTYALFSMHEGRTVLPKTNFSWNLNLAKNKEAAVAKARPGFEVEYEYNFNWKAMKIENHIYILT